MLYVLVRLLISAIVFGLIILVLKKTNKLKKASIIVSIVAFFAIYSLLFFLPFENLFITFKTPQDAFNYRYIGKIEEVVNGKNSSLIFYSVNNSDYSMAIIYKKERGYKFGVGFSHEKVYSKLINNVVEIYKVKKTTDNYVIIFGFIQKNEVEIYDSNNSDFICFDKPNSEYVMLSAFVDDMPDDYYVNVNGDEFYLNE